MLKKFIIFSILVSVCLSCSSSNNDPATTSGTNSNTTTVAMTTNIDGVLYDTPPQNNGNTADATGEIFGNSYYLLAGYKSVLAGKALIGNKVFDIKIAVPKNDLTPGIHYFGSNLVVGDYYADFDISGVTPAETVNTTSGSVTIISYDTTTKLLKGTFTFTTNNGVNMSADSHTLVGSFSYVLP